MDSLLVAWRLFCGLSDTVFVAYGKESGWRFSCVMMNGNYIMILIETESVVGSSMYVC
jgi:hypothetical protein